MGEAAAATAGMIDEHDGEIATILRGGTEKPYLRIRERRSALAK
jgi:hypothetical protein